MKPSLSQLLRQAENLSFKELRQGYRDFMQWHQSCVEFLELLVLEFKQTVESPLDIERGLR